MMPCWVRLTAATSADLRHNIAGAEAAVDDADAPFFGQDRRHRRPRDRVHVGRHERTTEGDVLGEPGGQVDDGRIPARDHTELRREQKIVEGTAPDKGQEIRVSHLPLKFRD